jgi:hypothetical protein
MAGNTRILNSGTEVTDHAQEVNYTGDIEATLSGSTVSVNLTSSASAAIGIISDIPTADAEDGETIWNDGGVLKVSSSG